MKLVPINANVGSGRQSSENSRVEILNKNQKNIFVVFNLHYVFCDRVNNLLCNSVNNTNLGSNERLVFFVVLY